MASCSTAIVLLARLGITGPLEVIEGEKGLMDAITGLFEIDWSREDLERVKHTILKKYNAEIHSQTAIDGVFALKQRHQFQADEVKQVNLEKFPRRLSHYWWGRRGRQDFGRKHERAGRHSFPDILAVAILDGKGDTGAIPA